MWERKVAYVLTEIVNDLLVGSLDSEIGSSGRGRPRSGKSLGGVEASKWWNTTLDRGCLRDGGRLQDDFKWRKL